jgi:hypothetical protein
MEDFGDLLELTNAEESSFSDPKLFGTEDVWSHNESSDFDSPELEIWMSLKDSSQSQTLSTVFPSN